MRPSDWFTETRVIWGHLPLLARYAVSGAVLGAVGYLMHRIGLDGALPREMRYPPPTSHDSAWRQHARDRYQQHGRPHDGRHR